MMPPRPSFPYGMKAHLEELKKYYIQDLIFV